MKSSVKNLVVICQLSVLVIIRHLKVLMWPWTLAQNSKCPLHELLWRRFSNLVQSRSWWTSMMAKENDPHWIKPKLLIKNFIVAAVQWSWTKLTGRTSCRQRTSVRTDAREYERKMKETAQSERRGIRSEEIACYCYWMKMIFSICTYINQNEMKIQHESKSHIKSTFATFEELSTSSSSSETVAMFQTVEIE